MKGNMALDKAKIVEELSNATVIEIAELVKELETKWGVSAAAPVAVPLPLRELALPRPPPKPRPSLTSSWPPLPADKKIAVIKAVREVKAGLGLGGSQGPGRRRAQAGAGRRQQG